MVFSIDFNFFPDLTINAMICIVHDSIVIKSFALSGRNLVVVITETKSAFINHGRL